MRVALCQIPVSSRPDINSERVRAALGQAADGGADLAVFPEATQIRFGSDLRAAAEPLDGPFCSRLADAAKQAGVAVVAGVFEPAPDGRVYNTAVAYDGAGELVASYRKLHLFDAFGQRESDQVAPGSAPVICTLAGMRTGLQICYDVRFGELSRALAVGGASLLVLPAAWAAGLFKEDHWVTLGRGRAIENTVWVAAAGGRPLAARAPRGLGRGAVQGGPLGDAGAGPGHREHRVGRRRRAGPRPGRAADPGRDRGRAQHAGGPARGGRGRPRAQARGAGRGGRRRPDQNRAGSAAEPEQPPG